MTRRPSLPSLVGVLLLAIVGCGSGYALSDYVLPAYAGGPPAFALYHAYGDSITAGATLQDPATEAYPALVAKAEGLTLTNHAVGGDQACDVSTRQIFPAADMPTLAAPALYTLLISTNDLDTRGAGSYEAVFNLCQQASIAWLAVPVENKVLATSTLVTSTGPVLTETANHWNALTTNALNASIRIPFTHPAPGPLYLWYRIHDGSTGSFTYALDGATLGSATTGSTPAIRTIAGTTDSLALLRIPAVPAGAHTLTITQTNVGPTAVGIVALGIPPATPQPNMPLVLVGTTPRQLDGTGAPCAVNAASCQAYIADITANAALFAADGLNIKLFTAAKYMLGQNIDMSDVVHPNLYGQLEIARALLEVLDPPKPKPTPTPKP